MKFETPEVITCDVLVIGGGVAAVTAVENACKNEASVCIADRGFFGSVGVRGFGVSCFDSTGLLLQ